METNFSKPNPKKLLGYLMAFAMVFFSTSYTVAQTTDVDITVGGGSYDSEITWDLTDATGAIVSSGAAGSVTATVDVDGCYDMNMYDSWGDGWNGGIYTITDIASGVVYGTGGLTAGSAGTDNVCMTAPATCTDNEVDFNMYDTWGDGWNGGTYTLTDDAGNVVGSGGLLSGAAGTDSYCLVTGCYDLTVGGGSYDSEIAWDMTDASGGVISMGVAGTTNYISVGGATCGPSGCTDPTAFNYDPAAVTDDGSCVAVVLGCTDSTATNYDPAANTDDGSCVVVTCTDYTIVCDGGAWQSEVGWTISDSQGNIVASGGAPSTQVVCLEDDCYTVDMTDAFGDGWNGNVLTVSTSVGSFASDGLTTGAAGSFTFCTPPAGCTDASANNYDPVAVSDDGSCTYACAAAYCSDFEAGTGNWTNNGWTWDFGGTTSGATGPTTGANGSTYYMYFETSSPAGPGTTVSMTSECMDISGLTAPALAFSYHMYGATMGTLDVLVNGTNVWTMSGDQGNQWNSTQVDLSAYAGLDVTIEFVGTYGTSFSGDMAIDDVCVTEFLVISGCTDPVALNYDPTATQDDGSCTYCTDNLVDVTVGGGSFQAEVSWTLLASDGVTIVAAGGAPYSATLCLPDDCYTLDMVDSWGDGWNGNVFDMSIGGASIGSATLAQGTNGTADISVGVLCPVLGCTDPTATNYDPAANTDDGSCQYSCTAAPYLNDFDAGVGTMTNNGWTLDSYGTPSVGTGPDDDITGGGNYIYYETSGAPAASISITSECLDASGLASPCLSFYYSMNGATCGDLIVYANGNIIWQLAGNQGAGWNWAQVSLDSVANLSDVTLEFQANYGGGFTGDIALDNISVDECLVIAGCTDPTALNYDPSANQDDGSCTYCTGTFVTLDMADAFGDGWNGNTWVATGTNTGTVYGPFTIASGASAQEVICMDDDCYDIVVDGGTWQSEVSWTVTDLAGNILASGGAPHSDNMNVNSWCPTYGCIDTLALNYDSLADTDDGSCAYICDVYIADAVVDAVPSCYGASDAQATAIISGTFGNDYYLWSDGQTTSTATGLSAGTYTCTVTDSVNGCVSTATVVINETPDISISAATLDATPGQSNGGVDITVSGGTPCYNGAAMTLASGVATTTQWGANAFDVIASSDLQITSVDMPTMMGMGDMYVWYRLGSGSGFEQDPNGWMLAGTNMVLAAGTGDITNVPVAISLTAGDTICVYVQTNGLNVVFGAGATPAYTSVSSSDANLSVLGGIAAGAGAAGTAMGWVGDVTSYDFGGSLNYSLSSYTYAWSTGATTEDVSGLGLGPVSVTVTDCNGCTATWSGFVLTNYVYGCTDTLASNYDASANTDDGSCLYDGCTDSLAANYDATANNDDGSCTYSCNYYGYDDEMTITLTPDWFTSEISWIMLDANLDTVIASNAYANGGAIDVQTVCAMNGCFFLHGYDSFGDGWGGGILDVTDAAGNTLASLSLSATTFESTLFSLGGANCTAGCTDTSAANYDASATIDDGSCLDTIYGCTDPLASNTTPYANVDDGSCVYCTGTYVNITVGGGSWQAEVSWTISDSAGTVVAAGGAPYNADLCLPDDCYTVDMFDSFGDGWNGNVMDITDFGTGAVIASDGLSAGAVGQFQFSTGSAICAVYGCIDPTAVNYDPAANTDDGSCQYSCTAAPYVETFDAGTGTWSVNGWTLDALGTTSSNTGPSDDITGGGNYMYFETSFPVAVGDQVSMTSECLDISTLTNPCLRWNYHMFGASIGTLEVFVNGTSVWSLSGDQGNQWNDAQVDLSAYVGSNVTVEFVGTAGANTGGTVFYGDMAIDQVHVDECVTLPVYGCIDTLAANYDPAADTDDGSCWYLCQENSVDLNMYDSFGDGWNGGIYTITDLSTGTVVQTGGLTTGVFQLDSICLPDGCYEIVVGGGSWDSEISFDFAGLVGAGVGTYNVPVGITACPVFGCTDSLALNYDPNADTDDGSCILACTAAPTCESFDAGFPGSWTNNGWILDGGGTPSINTGPGDDVTGGGLYMFYETSGAPQSPISMTTECYDISSLTAPALAFNYHMWGATMGTLDVLVNGTNVWSMSGDQGNQWNWAQVDLSAYAGSTNLTVEFVGTYGTGFTGDMAVDQVCLDEYLVIAGCTDPAALNYDPTANVDDGSCNYCTDNSVDITVDGGLWQGEVSWTLSDDAGNVVASGGAPYTGNVCITDGCYTVDMFDSFGDGWNGNVFDATLGGVVVGTGTLASGSAGSFTFAIGTGVCPVLGCTDSAAVNYDPTADTDDGSCDYLGCTNPTATNYDPAATIDDGSCTFGCQDNTVNVTAGGGSYDSEVSWDIVDGSGTVVASGLAGAATTYCLPDDCYTVNMYDSWGDGWNGATITLDDGAGVVYATDGLLSGSAGSFTVGIGTSCPVYGCTDPTALNYDPAADTDDGSCTYCTVDVVTLNLYDSWGDGWNGNTLTVGGSDYTIAFGSSESFTLCIDLAICNDVIYNALGTYQSENSWDIVDGSGAVIASGAANSSTVGYCFVQVDGCTDSTALNYDPAANTDDGSCIYCVDGCTDPAAFNYDSLATCDDGSCIAILYGCTDPAADNYFAGANTDDGSCVYAGCTDPGACNYDPTANADDGSCEYTSCAGCTDPAADNYDANATIDDGSCTYTISGCTDPAADNYDPTATVDDGSCTYPSTCNKPTPTGIHVSEIIHNRVRVHWDNMTSGACLPKQYRIQYREVGTTAWGQRNAQDAGLCNFGLATTSKRLTNLNPGTDYEYRIKAWYCNTTGSSIWSAIDTFTTAPLCPNVGNFSVSTPLTTRAQFDWDNSNGVYSFVRIKLRVDSISNPTGADWQSAGGFGVNYGTYTRNKNGLVPGETYRGQSRTWCDPAGGMYKAPSWTSLIFWTQPTVVRMEGGTAINNLDVYPNPSRDIFNVSFTSEDVQDLEVRIINVVGEVVYTESLQQFIGEYTKQVDLATYTKGVYFLEITTNNGVINKKLILQ